MLNYYRKNQGKLHDLFKDHTRRNFEEMKMGNRDESALVVAERKRRKKLEDVFSLKKPA